MQTEDPNFINYGRWTLLKCFSQTPSRDFLWDQHQTRDSSEKCPKKSIKHDVWKGHTCPIVSDHSVNKRQKSDPAKK